MHAFLAACLAAGHDMPIAPNTLPNKWRVGHEYRFLVNIPTNSTADISLRSSTVLDTDPTFTKLYGEGTSNPQVVMLIESIEVVPISPTWPVIDIAEKYKLIKGLQFSITQAGTTDTYKIGLNITDAWRERTLATADDGARFDGFGPFFLPGGPRLVNLQQDEVEFKLSTASPTVSGGVDVELVLRGASAPSVEAQGALSQFADVNRARDQIMRRYLTGGTAAMSRAA